MTTKNLNKRAKQTKKDKEGIKQNQAEDELFRWGGGLCVEEKELAEIQGGFAEEVFLRWGRIFFGDIEGQHNQPTMSPEDNLVWLYEPNCNFIIKFYFMLD